MSDFFETKTENEEQANTLKIGEKEYTQEEVESMVSRAEQIAELENKYNTKVDKVWPEYGKSQNKLKQLEQELEELRSKATQQPEPMEGGLDEASIAQAREQAKKIGIVTEDQFGEYMAKSFRQFYTQERSAEKLIEQGQALEKQIDGSDGRPKFDLENILEYMAETGHKDLMKAYKDKYDSELDKWKEEQIKREKGNPFVTQESSFRADRSPSPIKPTEDNIYQLVAEEIGNY